MDRTMDRTPLQTFKQRWLNMVSASASSTTEINWPAPSGNMKNKKRPREQDFSNTKRAHVPLAGVQINFKYLKSLTYRIYIYTYSWEIWGLELGKSTIYIYSSAPSICWLYIYIRFIRDTTMALPVTWLHWKTPSTMAELGRSLCLNNRMASTWRTVSDAVHLNESFLKDILIMVCVRAHVSVCIYI